MRWYKRDPAAFIGGVVGLTLEEVGAYALILDDLYHRNGAVPDDERYVSQLLRCDVRVWRRIRQRLLDTGKLLCTACGQLTNARATSEISRAIGAAHIMAELGRRSAEKRKQIKEGRPTPTLVRSKIIDSLTSSSQEPSRKGKSKRGGLSFDDLRVHYAAKRQG
jgi:uncharacterized protein YdaU (DUF1376 family)